MKIERDELLAGHMTRTRELFDNKMDDADRQKAMEVNGARIMILGSAKLHGLTDALVEKILELRLWKVFGYSRFGDYLDLELGLPYDLMMLWVQEALRRGIEDKMIYLGPLVEVLRDQGSRGELTTG
ncbi:MAG: hypothetical protein WCI95_12275 [bacterium]